MRYHDLFEAHHAYDELGYDTKFAPLKRGDTVRVFHGFRDDHDAMVAATKGLSGATRANRVYSYEADNNPKGLFVTLSPKIAAEFIGGYGIQTMVEFNAKESDLEAPVWPGGSYTVQGQYSQYFGHGAKGRAGRRQAQRDNEARVDSETHHGDNIKQSDRKHLASLMMQTREHQALFIGHLDPTDIIAFHVRPRGSNTSVPFERISREEYIERYQAEIKIPNDKDHDRIFQPNEEFDGEKFVAAIVQRYGKYGETGLASMWADVLSSKKNRAAIFAQKFEQFLWPKQMPMAVRWFNKNIKPD